MRSRTSALGCTLALTALQATACKSTTVHHHHYTVDPGDTGEPGELPLVADTPPGELDLEVFEEDGLTWWIDAPADQVEAMNEDFGDGGWWESDGVYDIGGATYAERLLIRARDGRVADFGKVEVHLAGESTGALWTPSTIPNFKLDSDEFIEDNRFGDTEHVRLNNGQVGSMFGEASSLAVFRGLGLPAARSSYAWVGGTGWEDDDLLVPMVAREVYKGDFCEDHAEALGGGCVTIREGVGDINTPGAWGNLDCKHGDCGDTSRLDALAEAIVATQGTEHFEEATSEYLDWDHVRRMSCASWLLWTGDDYFHNTNNVVLAEGLDGRFRLLPYSTDITAGYAWSGAYSNTPLWGWASLSWGCKLDEGCREATYDTCEAMIQDYEDLDAPAIIDALAERLRETTAPWGEEGQGMWREPDDAAWRHFRAFHTERPAAARVELEALRNSPDDTGGWDTGVFEHDAPASP